MLGIFLIIGAIFIILAIVFALPGMGVGMFIPLLGDAIDVPLAFLFGLMGIICLLIGGLLAIILNYWWIILIGIIIWITFILIKLFIGTKRHKKRRGD